MAPPVFKTGGRRAASSAGSIPVRLRENPALAITAGYGPTAVTCQEPEHDAVIDAAWMTSGVNDVNDLLAITG